MKMKTVKKASDVTLAGISVELSEVDGNVHGIILRDGAGGVLEVRKTDWSMHVLIPAPPAMVDKWQIRGSTRKVPVCETFDDEHSARMRAIEIGDWDEPVEPTKIQVPEAL